MLVLRSAPLEVANAEQQSGNDNHPYVRSKPRKELGYFHWLEGYMFFFLSFLCFCFALISIGLYGVKCGTRVTLVAILAVFGFVLAGQSYDALHPYSTNPWTHLLAGTAAR